MKSNNTEEVATTITIPARGGWSASKKKAGSKYANKKTEKYGEKFDSKLEQYGFEMLTKLGFDFEFQHKYEIQPSHVNWEGVTRKRISLYVDFLITLPGGLKIYFDTKGAETEESILKYKILSYQLNQKYIDHRIVWKYTKSQVLSFVLHLKKEFYGG
jgi:hypothetical protein